MIFRDIPAGTALFLDANALVYHFIAHPAFGAAATDLLDRIERQEVQGYISSVVLGETAHRLMTFEAAGLFGWPAQGMAHRLKRHPAEVQQLKLYRRAIDEITAIGIQILAVSGTQVSRAANVCQQYGLLSNDALIVTMMRDNGLTYLASHDADFDRVQGITRYAVA